MYITINNINIEIVIERKNIKNMYMRIKEDLKLHITVNRFIPEKEILKTINNNQLGIIKMYNKASKKHKQNVFKCLGDEYNIICNLDINHVHFDHQNVYTKDTKQLDKYYLTECKKLLASRFETQYKLFDYLPSCKLRFRKMSSRWGVNNVRMHIITLNTELYKYDVSLIDYVIIHELCHFKEANHSSKFWQEVAKYYPEYKLARKLLKD